MDEIKLRISPLLLKLKTNDVPFFSIVNDRFSGKFTLSGSRDFLTDSAFFSERLLRETCTLHSRDILF